MWRSETPYTKFVVIELHAVEREPSEDVVEVLTRLLIAAKAGEVTGLAYVLLKPGGGYSADVVGSVISQPLLALGVAKALEIALTKHL
jgi:hypothetical protein